MCFSVLCLLVKNVKPYLAATILNMCLLSESPEMYMDVFVNHLSSQFGWSFSKKLRVCHLSQVNFMLATCTVAQ